MFANLFIIRKLGNAIAILAIMLASIMLITMSANAYLKEHHRDFEVWASNLLQTPIHIHQAEISWHHLQPGLDLNGVSFLSSENHKPVLQIKKIIIHLSIFKSLLALTPVPNGMSVKGTEINLFQSSQGNIAVHGFPALSGFNAELDTQPTSLEKIFAFISVQPRISLQDIDVRYVSAQGQKFYLTLFKLKLRNQGEQHSISGKAILHQQLPTEIQMAINWRGNELDFNKIKGESYFYISGVSLLQWLEGRNWSGLEIKKGIGSAKVWANWQNGQWQVIQLMAQLYDLNLYSNTKQKLHRINRISGNFGLRREADGNFRFAASDVLVDLPQHLLPLTSFEGIFAKQQDHLLPKSLSFGFLPLDDLKNILLDSSLLSDSQQKWLKLLRPEGSLRNTHIVFQDQPQGIQNFRFATEVLNLGVHATDNYPGIRNFSGKLWWDGKQGQVEVNSKNFSLHLKNVKQTPVKLDQVIGKILVANTNDKAAQLEISNLMIDNVDFRLNANGIVNLPTTLSDLTNLDVDKIQVNLLLVAPRVNAPHLKSYLPKLAMDTDLVAWLEKAFLTGQFNNVKATIQGSLAEFPFDQGNGQFSMSAQLQDIELHYADDWPNLTKVQGEIAFFGRSLSVSASQAKLAGIALQNIEANIGNLSADKLNLEVGSDPINTDFQHTLQLIRHSPLQKTIGIAFNKLKLTGPLMLKLGISVPLSQPGKTTVQGSLQLQNDNLSVEDIALAANHLNGTILLTENSFTAQGVTGELLGKPMRLDLDTLETGVRATIKNHLALKDLEQWLKISFQPYAKGDTDFVTTVDCKPDAPLLVHLQSNLKGIRIDWQNLFTKEADKAENLNLDLLLQENSSLHMKLDYENNIKAAFAVQPKNHGYELLAANLHLGTGDAKLPEEGILITGNFDELQWSDIKRFISNAPSSQASSLKLTGIELSAKTFRFGSNYVNQIHLQATPQEDSWNVKISGKDAVGHLNASQDLGTQGHLNAVFERLILHEEKSKPDDLLDDTTKLPAIDFQARYMNYHNIPLGHIILKTTPKPDGMLVKKLQVDSKYLSFHAGGSWQKQGTKLQGTASSENVSELLTSFGLEAHNFISSRGQLKFNLNWGGSLFNPQLASLNGKASLNLGPGRIVDVGEASGAKMDLGKLLSIFSLQTIPRRLTLDFSDVFQKGYSFDALNADFNFNKGNAYTNNMRFSGPVASVNIRGRMGFAQKDLDLFLNVSPHIAASSLPVAATLLGITPVVGIAALAVGTVIGSSQAVSMNYTVDGPWTDPIWRSVNDQSKKI